MEGRENEERKWNLYSKAESITVSIGGNVHGVMPYLDNYGSSYMDLISLQNIQANDGQNGGGTHRSSRTRSLMSSRRTRYVAKRPENRQY